jgi:hypothetical protein
VPCISIAPGTRTHWRASESRDGASDEGVVLLLLLGVKHSLLSFHPLYQFLDPIKRRLIGDPGRHSLVIPDLAVEFDALLTHLAPVRIRTGAAIDDRLLVKTV